MIASVIGTTPVGLSKDVGTSIVNGVFINVLIETEGLKNLVKKKKKKIAVVRENN